MIAKELLKLAEHMIDHCEKSRTCFGCAGKRHIDELKGCLCDVSEHSDNRNQSVADIMEAVKNGRHDD